MSKDKVKGLLKGLRYISQIYDEEKDQEIQIGIPTDVKHVAHIGWDGPSVNSPSWMNEFKSSPGLASAPLNHNNGDNNKDSNDSVKRVSEDPRSRSMASNSPARDLTELPKSTRRQSTGGMTDSLTREKSDKPKGSRRPSKPKDSSDGSRLNRKNLPTESLQGSESPASNTPDVPKKTRRKKSKDTSTNGGGVSSSRMRVKAQTCTSDSNSDLGSPSGSISKSRNYEVYGESEKGQSGIS